MSWQLLFTKREAENMTTIFMNEITCGFCGKKGEHEIIGSTNTFGSMDLDTRPPAHMRYTINTWVQRCPHCGCCASNIQKITKAVESIVNSREYQSELSSSEYPELANSFLCKAMLENENGYLVQATWTTIHAAWACDDAGDYDSAKKCRMKAVKLIKEVGLIGQTIADEPEAEIAITVDLLRRSGQFNEALQMIGQKQSKIKDEIIRKVLKFQKKLILRSDHQCYTISECLG
jgi:hypothetical protein